MQKKYIPCYPKYNSLRRQLLFCISKLKWHIFESKHSKNGILPINVYLFIDIAAFNVVRSFKTNHLNGFPKQSL